MWQNHSACPYILVLCELEDSCDAGVQVYEDSHHCTDTTDGPARYVIDVHYDLNAVRYRGSADLHEQHTCLKVILLYIKSG